MPRIVSRFGVNVAGALPFEELGAFGRLVTKSRPGFSELPLSRISIVAYSRYHSLSQRGNRSMDPGRTQVFHRKLVGL